VQLSLGIALCAPRTFPVYRSLNINKTALDHYVNTVLLCLKSRVEKKTTLQRCVCKRVEERKQKLTTRKLVFNRESKKYTQQSGEKAAKPFVSIMW
jgi:hypothetical protein